MRLRRFPGERPRHRIWGLLQLLVRAIDLPYCVGKFGYSFSLLLKVDDYAQENGRYPSAAIRALVLCVCEFYELTTEFFRQAVLLCSFEGVHGRPVESPK